ncbi:hypothetical protein C1645_739519 [Glomus cerebriforme]|uniref:Uncharacterized protein n=1 Tax=Glomus cerebriforme TaxID=658196 RepID=A0A397SW94_9GLOM|nr:hypothetical protein C1645_739519 [Glomus cerebriforme]
MKKTSNDTFHKDWQKIEEAKEGLTKEFSDDMKKYKNPLQTFFDALETWRTWRTWRYLGKKKSEENEIKMKINRTITKRQKAIKRIKNNEKDTPGIKNNEREALKMKNNRREASGTKINRKEDKVSEQESDDKPKDKIY